MSGEARNVPARLAEMVQRFEHWRASRARRGRIPAVLWEAAEALAGEHGTYRTARALHLNYAALAKRVRDGAGRRRPRFVEFAPSAVLPCSSCVLKLEAPNGAKLHLELQGFAVADVVAVARGVWSRGE